MRTTMIALAVLTVTSGAAAQEKPAEEARPPRPAQAQEGGGGPRGRRGPRSACSKNPYDISSFYRSGESPLGPWAGPSQRPRATAIAGFYRAHRAATSGTPHGWSAFWTSGYLAPRPTPLRGPTAARSARTATSSSPCRSSRRSARSAARSSAIEARGLEDGPAGLAAEAVGEALEAAHRLVALHALDPVHRVEERHEAEQPLLAARLLPQPVVERARSMPRTTSPAGWSESSTPQTFSLRLVQVEDDRRPSARSSKGLHLRPPRRGVLRQEVGDAPRALLELVEGAAKESAEVARARRSPRPAPPPPPFSSSSRRAQGQGVGTSVDRQRETFGKR